MDIDIAKLGLMLSPVALAFGQVRSKIQELFSFLIRKDVIVSVNVRECILTELVNNSIFFPALGGNSLLYPRECFSKSRNSKFTEVFKIPNRAVFLYKNFFPIIFGISSDATIIYLNIPFVTKRVLNQLISKFEQTVEENQSFFKITEYNGKSLKKNSDDPFDFDEDGANPTSHHRKPRTSGDFYSGFFWQALPIYQPSLMPCDDLERHKPICPNDYYIGPELQKLKEDIQFWVDSESWCYSRNVSWRRSTLVYGEPGTGKSSGIKRLAEILDIPIDVVNVSTMDNSELDSYVSKGNRKVIVLFEDIDRVFEGEENKVKNDLFGGVTFDHFINKLSGVNAITNAYVILTANDISKLSDALTRSGRVDNKIEIPKLGEAGKRHIANSILRGQPELIEQILREHTDCTGADFENACVKLAIANKWESKK